MPQVLACPEYVLAAVSGHMTQWKTCWIPESERPSDTTTQDLSTLQTYKHDEVTCTEAWTHSGVTAAVNNCICSHQIVHSDHLLITSLSQNVWSNLFLLYMHTTCNYTVEQVCELHTLCEHYNQVHQTTHFMCICQIIIQVSMSINNFTTGMHTSQMGVYELHIYMQVTNTHTLNFRYKHTTFACIIHKIYF